MTDTFTALLLTIDTAALVLIWIVQLVVYPSFSFYSIDDIRVWHPIYTRRVTSIVLPIMVAQVILYGLAISGDPSLSLAVPLILITAIWGITFLWAVPLHSRLDSTSHDQIGTTCRQLIKINWPRTILWSAVWLLSCYRLYLTQSGA